jgi:hypothetical protein
LLISQFEKSYLVATVRPRFGVWFPTINFGHFSEIETGEYG